MAIDSASKRASALGFGLVALSLVIPSGTIDQQARQTLSNIYSGILAGAIITSPTVVIIKFDASNNVINIQESDRDINVINPNRRIIF